MGNIEIWPGDFFSFQGKGITAWMNSHWTKTPSGKKTSQYHFGMIADPVYDEEGNLVDFETRESILKGPATLRFFAHNSGRVVLYRLPGITKEEGIRMVRSISKIGACPYGFKDFLHAFADVACLLITLQRPPYTAYQFSYSGGDEYLCTELCAFGAKEIGKPIEPPGQERVWDIPVVYLQAEEEVRLYRYFDDNIERLHEQYLKGMGNAQR